MRRFSWTCNRFDRYGMEWSGVWDVEAPYPIVFDREEQALRRACVAASTAESVFVSLLEFEVCAAPRLFDKVSSDVH